MSLSEKLITLRTQDLCQYNTSNQTAVHKSLKYKLLSFFGFRHKHPPLIEQSCNVEHMMAQTSPEKQSTPSVVSYNTVSEKATEPIKEYEYDRLDSHDRELVDKFPMHSFVETVIDCVNEEMCLNIKLPKSLTSDSEVQITNNTMLPFLSSVPGVVGLKNHRNTCYVNVIIQCLSCIDTIAEYFATKDYLPDLHPVPYDPDTVPSVYNVSSLDVLLGLSYLLQSMWQLSYHPTISLKFYQLLALHNTQYTVDSQQDAHELLLCLLNILHENLIRPRVKKSKRASSFIFDRFRGWLSTVVTCPQCGYSDNSTNQMLSLNLQIPKNRSCGSQLPVTRLFSIIVTDGNQIAKKHAFEIDGATTVADIREGIAERIGCPAQDIILLDLMDFGFGKLYSDSELIVDVSQKNNYLSFDTNDNFEEGLYALHIMNQVVDVDTISLDKQSLDDIYSSITSYERCDIQPFITILVVHVEKTKNCAPEYMTEINAELKQILSAGNKRHGYRQPFTQKHFQRFTNVFTMQASTKTKMSLLRHSISEQMCKYLSLRNITKLPKPQYIIEGSHLITEMDTFPLLHSSVMTGLKDSAETCGERSAVARIVVIWPFRTTDVLKFNRRASRENVRDTRDLSLGYHKISLHCSVDELSTKRSVASSDLSSNRIKKEQPITIYHCFKEFFNSASLSEAWNCRSCVSSQRARTVIRIKEAPEILIIMLKRFTTDDGLNLENLKINNNAHHKHLGRPVGKKLFKRSTPESMNASENINKLECLIEYPLKDLNIQSYMEYVADDESYLYDLVSVVNHIGNSSNGHYVAICQNSVDNQWRIFDDVKITDISESGVIQPDAYILFYKRQVVSNRAPSFPNLHWSYRRLAFPISAHRNQSPCPTKSYSKSKHSSERISQVLPPDTGLTSLTVSNNHNILPSLLCHNPTHKHTCPPSETVAASHSTRSLSNHTNHAHNHSHINTSHVTDTLHANNNTNKDTISTPTISLSTSLFGISTICDISDQ